LVRERSVVAIDPDRGDDDRLTYSIVSPASGPDGIPDLFGIDDDGVITLGRRPPDTADFTVTVRVTDSGGLFAEHDYQVHFKPLIAVGETMIVRENTAVEFAHEDFTANDHLTIWGTTFSWTTSLSQTCRWEGVETHSTVR
jgi:hypothetical protein